MELRYPSGATQPATGDPDGVNTPFIPCGPLVRLHLWQRVHALGPLPLRWPVTSDLLPSTFTINLLRAVRRNAGNHFCCPMNPFLAMSETIVPIAADVYYGEDRFSAR
ncbi:hypothetical protein, partial [Planobispora longispora]|uniref:hypothetical protein n=1 Tax=Planobispora longispora TaxID=28887 RepID=UPI0019423550